MVYTQEPLAVFFANEPEPERTSTSPLAAPLGMPLARHAIALTVGFSEAHEMKPRTFRGFCFFRTSFLFCLRGARCHEFQ
jgi:hypothetical protein